MLASTNNRYDPKALHAALRTQFGEVHLHERGYRAPVRRHAYVAECSTEEPETEAEEESSNTRDDEADDLDGGEWTDLEGGLAWMQEEVNAGRAVDEEVFALVAETLEQEQVAFVAR